MNDRNKKISLFLIATLVCFYGIGYSLVKGTRATSEYITDFGFEDVNLYECVMDTYINEKGVDIKYEDGLSDSALSTISSLDCSNREIKSAKGIEKLTSLQSLNISNNNLVSLDLSNNINLIPEETFIDNNNYGGVINTYNGDIFTLSTYVHVPDSFSWDSLVWESDNNSIATMNEDFSWKALSSGQVFLIGRVDNKYTVNVIVNVFDISSDKYIINDEDGYVYVGSDNDIDTIDNFIRKSSSDINLDINLDKFVLVVMRDDEEIKQYDIVSLSSSDYDLRKEYVYITDETSFDKNDILCNNCSLSVNMAPEGSEYLVVMYEDITVKRIPIIKLFSNKYDLTKGYIYSGVNELDFNDFVFSNCLLSIDESAFNMLYLVVSSEGLEIDRIPLVMIESDVYDLSKEYIYVVETADDVVSNNIVQINQQLITVKTGILEVDEANNKILIKYNDVLLDEYDIAYLKVPFSMIGNMIIISDVIDYNSFISGFLTSDNVSFNLFNGEEVVSSGIVEDGMIFKVYYGEDVISEYLISKSSSYINFDENLTIDNNNYIIKNIDYGTTVDEMLKMIDTNGEISILDKNNNEIDVSTNLLRTGDKVKIVLRDQTLVYTMSIFGDVTGDGIVNLDDVKSLSNCLIYKEIFFGNEYLGAGDINGNNIIDINDVIKLVKYIVTGNGL